MKEVYIWGAGHFGALAALDMEKKGNPIAGFIDSDKELQGRKRFGYAIFSPEQIINENNKRQKIVIATWVSVNEISDKLKKNGYVYGSDFVIFEEIKNNYRFEYITSCTFDLTKVAKTDINGKKSINDLELIKNIRILFENKVILYGYDMGYNEIALCRRLKEFGISVAYYYEKENSEMRKLINDIEIISLRKLEELDREMPVAIIIASSNVVVIDKIINEIECLKLKTNRMYTELALDICIKMIHIENALKPQNWILIYQFGKVGSTTIYKSIKEVGLNCFHVHSFKYLQNYISNLNRIKIITLVREPVGRNLSEVFQNLSPSRIHEMNLEQLISSQLFEGRRLFDWFDIELKEYIGIDIYAHPFDREKGYTIIKQGNVEVLAIKLEKLNTLGNVIGEFIGAKQFKLKNANEGDVKSYKYLYNNVKDAIRIPRDIFDIYYNNNAKMDHFYTEAEKEEFLKKWGKNIAD